MYKLQVIVCDMSIAVWDALKYTRGAGMAQ